MSNTYETGLQIKEVSFNGDNLIGIQNEQGIFTVVANMCKGIGLTEKQRDRQVTNIQSDLVLYRGTKKLPLKFGGQVRDVVCIMIDYIPLWLAKISITPKMKRENPELVEKLIDYQLKAKDVLAKAFLPKQYQNNNELSNVEFKQLQSQMNEFYETVQDIRCKQDIVQKQITGIDNKLSRLLPSPKYTNFKNNLNVKVEKLAKHLNLEHNKVLSMLYKQLMSEYDVDLEKHRTDYMIQNSVHNCTMLDVIDSSEELQNMMNCTINNILGAYNLKVKTLDKPVFEINPVKITIAPLIAKYQDKSHGGNATYRKVYFAMNVDWHNRQVRYKNKNNRKCLPSKVKLLLADEKLMNRFKKTVGELLQ